MIHKLKRKFILLATAAMLALMTVLLLAMNLINFTAVKNEADSVLSVLSHPDLPFRNQDPTAEAVPEGHAGSAPDKAAEGEPMPKPEKEMKDFLPPGMSPEVPYESRYFTVRLSPEGEILKTDVDRIVSVDSAEAEKYVNAARESRADHGFVGNFRFAKFADGQGTRIVFLDCGRRLDAFTRFMWISIAIGLCGCALVFLLFWAASGRIVRPMAESYAKQKRFITDAGHEMKTPLTVIAANAELLEADFGENECLSDIREQTERLAALTGDLVTLARMDEAETAILKTDFPVSDLVAEAAGAFRAPMTAQNRSFTAEITPGLSMHGSPGAVRQLVSVLLDNALKYSPEGGAVLLCFTASKRELVLSVKNTVRVPLREEDLPRLFDRFYRTDASRSSETGGHGIGLSVAKAIADAHGGKIVASLPREGEFAITVTFSK